MKSIDNIQKFFEKISFKMIKENNYSGIFKEIFKYGSKNIFILNKNYNDSWYVYYNNKTGKMFSEYYSDDTIFPADFSINDNILTFDEALELGLVNNIMIIENAKSHEIQKFMEMDELPGFNFLDARYNNIFPLRVTVNRGRKFRGDGYIIDAYAVESRYGKSYIGEIYDPKANTITDCTLDYVNFPESVLEQFRNYCIDIINSCTNDDVNKVNLRINKNIMDKTLFKNFVKQELIEQIDYSSARNLIKEKEEAKRKEQEEKNKVFKESKMKDLIEWVKKNTDKKGEEIEKLAERIYNKRYGY